MKTKASKVKSKRIQSMWMYMVVLLLGIPQLAIGQNTLELNEQEEARKEFFEQHLNKTLLGVGLLGSPTETQTRERIGDQFSQLDQLSESQINEAFQSGFFPSQLQPKARWYVLNESEMVGIRIHQRDRDRTQPFDWQLIRRVEMERNENRQMTMLKEHSGDPEDLSSLITYFEYDERGYPTRQLGYMSTGFSQIPYLDMRIEYDAEGRIAQIRERYYNVMGNQRSDTVVTRFQYQEQERSALRVEHGAFGHQHSDTTRTMFQEGNENEPLRLMIHQSIMAHDGQNGGFKRERTQMRYTYPTLTTIPDYFLKQTYYYDLVPYELEIYDEQSMNYVPYERLVLQRERGFSTLQKEMWTEAEEWSANDLWYVHFNERDKPELIEIYDQSEPSLYLFEAHEITSEFLTSVDQIEQSPTSVLLYQNYPNPFNPQTEITFEISEPEWVTLSVYDALGRKVVTLLDQVLASGRHQSTFDASQLPTGIYYYQIQAGDQLLTRNMIFAK